MRSCVGGCWLVGDGGVGEDGHWIVWLSRWNVGGIAAVGCPDSPAAGSHKKLCVSARDNNASPLLGHPLRGLALRARVIRVKNFETKNLQFHSPTPTLNSNYCPLTPDS